MFKLHVIQAEYGDCLILEYGMPSNSKYFLIDGGPETIYGVHLRDKLLEIRKNKGKLNLVILSHIDVDHITGLLDLMADLDSQRANRKTEIIGIDALWHNTFSQTIGSDIESRLKTLLSRKTAQSMNITGMVKRGIGEGDQLRAAANKLKIPINSGFTNDLVSVDGMPDKIAFDNLNLYVVGPTKKNLVKLRKEWLDWLDKNEKVIPMANKLIAAMVDRSVPNLSSIMILAEADGKRVLLTGDGRGDHLLQGLKQANLLSQKGDLHVDILKVPHHGSERNVTRKFFETVIADKYIISANGRDDNPDLSTLIWIVETAREKKQTIEIFTTNETLSTQKLIEEYDPKKYGYSLTIMKKGSHSSVLNIAS